MRVLITGAGKNLGLFLANRYADAGHDVWGVARRERPAELDARVFYERTDLAEPSAGGSLVERATPDLLVLNAIHYRPKSLDALTAQDLHTSFTVNALTPFLMAQSLLRRNRPATVLILNSDSAFQGSREYADYTASKAALLNLARSLAQAARGTPVNVASLILGPLSTPERQADIQRLKSLHGDRAADLEARALAKAYPWSTQTDFVDMSQVYQVLQSLTSLGSSANGLSWRLDAGCIPSIG